MSKKKTHTHTHTPLKFTHTLTNMQSNDQRKFDYACISIVMVGCNVHMTWNQHDGFKHFNLSPKTP